MSGDGDRSSMAARVRDAYERRDLDALADLLDPSVRWGAPGDPVPPCRSRTQVLAWYERAMANGLRGTVTSLHDLGDHLVVGLSVQRGGAPEGARWQVLTTKGGRIVEIVGFDTEAAALRAAGGAPALPHPPTALSAPAELVAGVTRVRVPRMVDARELHAHVQADGGLAYGWLPLPADATAEDCAALVADWGRAWSGARSFHGPALLVVADGTAIGHASLDEPGGGVVELAYGIAPTRRRQGHATRAVTAIVDWLLAQPSVTGVAATIASDGVASQRVATAAGLRRVEPSGRATNGEPHPGLRFERRS